MLLMIAYTTKRQVVEVARILEDEELMKLTGEQIQKATEETFKVPIWRSCGSSKRGFFLGPEATVLEILLRFSLKRHFGASSLVQHRCDRIWHSLGLVSPVSSIFSCNDDDENPDDIPKYSCRLCPYTGRRGCELRHWRCQKNFKLPSSGSQGHGGTIWLQILFC